MTDAESYKGRGLPFALALEAAPLRLVRTVVGEPLIDLLQLLDSSLANEQKLRELALQMVTPSEVLMETSQREQLVEALPIAKARELATAIGVETEPILQIYKRLNRALAEAEDLDALYSFFGIAPDERAVRFRRPPTTECRVTYGLFPHQRTAARRVANALLEEPRRALLHMPTGAGKTRTGMHIICEHLRMYGPTLVCWLANSPELLEQASGEFERAWNSLGDRDVAITRMWSDRSPDLSGVRDGVLVGGFQKLHALYARSPNELLKLGDRTTLTIVDEAHQSIAPTYRTVIEALSQKHPQGRLLGLSATPGRTWNDIGEDERLSAFYGMKKVTLDVEGYPDPVEYLIQNGYLAKPEFRTLNYEAGTKLQQQDLVALADALDVPEALLDALAEHEQRNLRIVTAVEELTTRHQRIIVFASSVYHAHLIRAVLSARGHEALVVTGDMENAARERAIRRFRGSASNPIVICNFGVLTTGFDAPKTSAAVIARPTRSLVLYSQMVGRATRGPKAGGNETAEIVTVVDPDLPGFGDIAEAFTNWEDVWRGC